MEITAYQIAERFIGTKEVAGKTANPQILSMLKLVDSSVADDEVAWCSAFVNYVTWLLRLPRSKSLRARSWLLVGQAVTVDQAKVGFDIVILNRANGPQDPDVIQAPGHVGLYAGQDDKLIYLLGGNQGDIVCVKGFPKTSLLGIRRIG